MSDLGIQVVFSAGPGLLDATSLRLPEGSTVLDAVMASGVLQRQPQALGLPVGVWGRKQSSETPLRDGDRVEIYRPLLCDPKEARRLRYRQRANKAAQAKPTDSPAPLPVKPKT